MADKIYVVRVIELWYAA